MKLLIPTKKSKRDDGGGMQDRLEADGDGSGVSAGLFPGLVGASDSTGWDAGVKSSVASVSGAAGATALEAKEHKKIQLF